MYLLAYRIRMPIEINNRHLLNSIGINNLLASVLNSGAREKRHPRGALVGDLVLKH